MTRRSPRSQLRDELLALLALGLVVGCSLSPSVMSSSTGGEGGSAEGGTTGFGSGADGSASFWPDASFVDRPPCQSAVCKVAGGQYCGKIGDGCGGVLVCGDCPAGDTCGGGGTKGVCGHAPDPACVPITCQQVGGRLCGRVGDGCGRPLDCGDCPGGEVCGATTANVCGIGAGVCDNLCKQQMSCPKGSDTVVSGTVRAPTPSLFGPADPLYNAVVYVPNAAVEPFSAGAACETCGKLSGSPLVTALTGPDGKFTLRNVPVGTDIPLVIQIGRWRRQVKIPKVTACQTTPVDPELTRLPRNKAEGDIPAIAIATGHYDPFDCTLRKIGIDASEFTLPDKGGRVNVWVYGGNTLADGVTPRGDDLTGNLVTLSKYDMVILPCDDNHQKPAASLQNLRDYTAKGGRVFLTDWGYAWLRDMGLFDGTVKWKADAIYQGEDFLTEIDTTFPKGKAFAQWLSAVGAIAPMATALRIHDPYTGASDVDDVVAPTQRWLYTTGDKPSVQHFTFNTPVTAKPADQCGRVVFSQFHVADPQVMPPVLQPHPGKFPMVCDDHPMSPQEKALEFMLFDASSCIQPDREPPRVFQPPPPAPPPAPAPIP